MVSLVVQILMPFLMFNGGPLVHEFPHNAMNGVPDTFLGKSNDILNPAHDGNDVDNGFELGIFDIPELSQEFKDVALAGIKSVYSDAPYLDKAFSAFDSLILLEPDRPEGYFLKAALYYSIHLVDESQAILDSLHTNSEKAISLTKEYLKKEPENQYLHFYLGGVYGNLGLQYLRQNKYWKAYRNGSKGKAYLQKALEIDPAFSDARLGIGMFQYYADILPKYMKIFLFFVRMTGDREAGLQNIRNAAENSTLVQIEANIFLARIYNEYEGKPDESEKLFQALYRQFPKNIYFQYSLARFYYENGHLNEAREIFEAMNTRPHPYYNRAVRYYLGNILHATGDYFNSTNHFKVLANLYESKSNDTMKERVYEIHYRTGLNYEYQNDRENAFTYYNRAKETRFKPLKDKLKEHLDKPLSDEDIRIKYVDSLLKSELYTQADKKIRVRIEQLKTENDDNEYYESKYNLLLAEAIINQGMLSDSDNIFRNYSENHFKDEKEWLARYHILGAVTNLENGNNAAVEEHIKKLKDLDFDKLQVLYLRKYNAIQNNVYGKVLYR